MSTRKTTREYRISQWFPIIKACRESGMSVRAWCKQNDVDEKRFYYWQNILRKTATETLCPLKGIQLGISEIILCMRGNVLINGWMKENIFGAKDSI